MLCRGQDFHLSNEKHIILLLLVFHILLLPDLLFSFLWGWNMRGIQGEAELGELFDVRRTLIRHIAPVITMAAKAS